MATVADEAGGAGPGGEGWDVMFAWLVEMATDTGWEPRSFVAATKAEAILVTREYRLRNPDDKFRVALYERRRPR